MNKLLSDIERIAWKRSLINKSAQLIQERIALCKEAIENAQANANTAQKSSAGDKYETSRAMSHLEKDMYSRQLLANQHELAYLSNINCSILYSFATAGSFIHCERFSFFIAAGLGKLNFESWDIYFLSPNAPLARQLYKKKQGDIITFNNTSIPIIDVF